MNVEEAKKMLSKGVGVEKEGRAVIKNLLSEVFDLGVKTVVITDGKNGSYSYDGNKYLHMATLDWPVVSVTGAGDAYASGFMAAIMKGLPTEEAMRWATVNAASVIGKYGPHTGTLKLDEMARLTKENENLRAVEI